MPLREQRSAGNRWRLRQQFRSFLAPRREWLRFDRTRGSSLRSDGGSASEQCRPHVRFCSRTDQCGESLLRAGFGNSVLRARRPTLRGPGCAPARSPLERQLRGYRSDDQWLGLAERLLQLLCLHGGHDAALPDHRSRRRWRDLHDGPDDVASCLRHLRRLTHAGVPSRSLDSARRHLVSRSGDLPLAGRRHSSRR